MSLSNELRRVRRFTAVCLVVVPLRRLPLIGEDLMAFRLDAEQVVQLPPRKP